MKAKIFAAIIFVSLLISQITFSQSTISIRLGTQTGQDCELTSYAPNSPWPFYPDIVTATWTYQGYYNLWRPLLKFNLTEIPSGSQIVSAKLSLFGNDYTSTGALSQGENESYIRKVTTQWDQYSVTWNAHPGYSTENQVLLPKSNSLMEDYRDIDVTDMVRDMVSNPGTNFGFIIMNKIESIYKSLNFASSEYPDSARRPLLVVTIKDPNSVELVSFFSIVIERNCYFKWTTSNEINNTGFEIYRSSGIGNYSFVKIGFVEGLGNNSGNHEYTFEDKNLNTGIYKYRLKQIDSKGNFEIFDLQNDVVVGIPSQYSISQNYPNPFNPVTKINYDIIHDGNVSIILYDVSGKEVKNLVNEYKPAGYYSLELNATDLPGGSYFYKIISGNFVYAKSMILLK